MSTPEKIAAFIERWSQAEASERANYALFLTELCDILDVPHPEPAGRETESNAYVFERCFKSEIDCGDMLGLAFGDRSSELRCL